MYAHDMYVYTVLYLLLVDCNPIGRQKPLVAFDVVDAISKISEALSEINLKQIAQKIF